MEAILLKGLRLFLRLSHGACILLCVFFRLFIGQRHLGDQLFSQQRIPHHAYQKLVDLPLTAEAQLHLGGMHIHIQKLRLDGQVQHHQRVLVLHEKALVAVLDGLVDDLALDITAIDKVNFVTTITSGNERLAQETTDRYDTSLGLHWDQIGCDLPAEGGINNVLQIVIAGGVQLYLTVYDQSEGHLRVGQSHALHQFTDIGALRHGGL